MKVKVKLRDMTKEQYKKWEEKSCCGECDTCPFRNVNCHSNEKTNWVNNKFMYSDKFLDQEVEIEIESILTDKEKEYLSVVIKPFREQVDYIQLAKYSGYSPYNEPTLFIHLSNKMCVTLPTIKNRMTFGIMELYKYYTLEEVGL